LIGKNGIACRATESHDSKLRGVQKDVRIVLTFALVSGKSEKSDA